MAFRKSSENRYLPNRRMKSNKNAIFNRGRQPHIRCYGRQNTEYLWAVLLPLKVVASKRENNHKMFERWKARKKEEENEEEEEVSMMRLLENSLNAKRVNETAVNAIACSSWGEISQHSLSFGSADGLYLHLSHSFSLSLALSICHPIFYPFISLLTTYLCCAFVWQVFLIDFRQKCSSIQAIFIWFNTFWLLLFVRRDRLFSYFSIDFDGNEIAGSARARSLCEHSFIVSCHQNYSFRVLVLPKINTISRRRDLCGHQKKNKNKKCDCKSIDKRCLRWFWFFFWSSSTRFSSQYSKICRHISCPLPDDDDATAAAAALTYCFCCCCCYFSHPKEIYCVSMLNT